MYSFCTLTLNSNSALYIAAGQTVNIYFDSPEACNLPLDDPAQPANGTTQMKLSSNTRITSSTGAPATVAIYFVGSQSRLTNLLMSSNTQVAGSCVQNFIIYAPLTHIEMNSNTQYCGAAGRPVAAHGLERPDLHRQPVAELHPARDSPALYRQPVPRLQRVERLAAQRRVLRGAGMETRRAIATETGGFTLPELLIATVLGLIVIGAAVGAMTVGVNSQPRLNSQAASVQQARTTMERITRELRQGSSVPTATASQLSIVTYVNSATCGGDSGQQRDRMQSHLYVRRRRLLPDRGEAGRHRARSRRAGACRDSRAPTCSATRRLPPRRRRPWA